MEKTINLLDIYSPSELAIKTYADLQERKERKKQQERDIKNYYYNAIHKSINSRK